MARGGRKYFKQRSNFFLQVVQWLSEWLHENNELAATYRTIGEDVKRRYGDNPDERSLERVIMRIWSKEDILKNVGFKIKTFHLHNLQPSVLRGEHPGRYETSDDATMAAAFYEVSLIKEK